VMVSAAAVRAIRRIVRVRIIERRMRIFLEQNESRDGSPFYWGNHEEVSRQED
jgi:hypothetical protein